MGHGGTLDPLATGVLIVGVGKGTKFLQRFLTCTKAYEATVVFGVATDTYDVQGKILSKAPYAHITKEKVEEALKGFRGQIMQRPPIFSALRIQGKRLYEYAREGKEVPVEIQKRPVTVEDLEILDWLEPGTHEYRWPEEEALKEEKEVAEKIFQFGGDMKDDGKSKSMNDEQSSANMAQRKRSYVEEEDELIYDTKSVSKRWKADPDVVMSGGLLMAEKTEPPRDAEEPVVSESKDTPPALVEEVPGPPAVKLRMTVTSGFYVRSLCHDLGKALGSLGIMSSLVRIRQGDYELGKNALDYGDLKKGEDVWAPKVKAMLEDWQEKNQPSSGTSELGESKAEPLGDEHVQVGEELQNSPR